MRRLALIAAFIGLAGLYTAFARADNANSAPASPAAAEKTAIPLRGTLYRIDHRGHTAYLFGTVHVGQNAFYPLEPLVTRALQEAGTLALEIDLRDTVSFQQAVVKNGMYTDGRTVADHLSTDSVVRLKDVLQHAGIPFASVARMKPWMIANLLIVQAMARAGYPMEQGLDLYFLSVAEKEGKNIVGLETADYQLSLFNHLDDAQQQAYLEETLHDLDDGSELADSLALIDAWRQADSGKMEALKRAMLNDEAASSRFIEDILLNRRNPGMTDKVEALLANDKITFIAVGALHLLGAGGIPDLLQQRGYRVTKMY